MDSFDLQLLKLKWDFPSRALLHLDFVDKPFLKSSIVGEILSSSLFRFARSLKETGRVRLESGWYNHWWKHLVRVSKPKPIRNNEGWAEGRGGGEGNNGLSKGKQDLETMPFKGENTQINRTEKTQLCVVLKVGWGLYPSEQAPGLWWLTPGAEGPTRAGWRPSARC